MPLSQTYHYAAPDAFTIGERQRKDLGDLTELRESIARHGLINPITVTPDLTLIAGERRLTCIRQLAAAGRWSGHVPYTLLEELSSHERQEIELEENIKRRELHWQEKAKAVLRYHDLRSEEDSSWTLAKTAAALLIEPTWCADFIAVGRALVAGDSRVLNSSAMSTALGVLERERDRALASAVADITRLASGDPEDLSEHPAELAGEVLLGLAPSGLPPGDASSYSQGDRLLRSSASPEFLVADFAEWAAGYSGRPFNLIHCDFPYGINHHKSDQGGSEAYGAYQDDPDTYWRLCGALADNLDRLAQPSAHLLFWFSMSFYTETLAFFARRAPQLEFQPFPLIWMKSDGRGILPDPKRGPRRIYETALLASLGDRPIVKPKANAYACPSGKSEALHLSEKPEPMLRHFMEMLVDEYTEILDPTCGAGSSLRAASSLGARRVLGLDISAEHIETSARELERARRLAKLSHGAGNYE